VMMRGRGARLGFIDARFWERCGGAIRVMRDFRRWIKYGWHGVEEAGGRGSVTWQGGARDVCFFCEGVAGSTGFARAHTEHPVGPSPCGCRLPVDPTEKKNWWIQADGALSFPSEASLTPAMAAAAVSVDEKLRAEVAKLDQIR
jgi:hypothetical protein